MGNCTSITVQPGDYCDKLAMRCGISTADLLQFNNAADFCTTLRPGQGVCCTAGTLPDLSPQPNADGTCAAYTVKSGDICDTIGANNRVTADKIELYNKQTWGWTGCNGMLPGMQICLSTGAPPMPPVSNAQCGPQVAGTQRPSDWSTIASLNPCPINGCCSSSGFCGITPEYCTVTQSPTGAPGTTGCISNCGTSVVNNGQPPAQFVKVGYFEGFNPQRPCLNMRADQIPGGYSHVHFAFAGVSAGFGVSLDSSVTSQFQLFVKQTGFKKILSFGGWSFATSTDSYPIFSQNITDDNRSLFAQNVVNFIQQQGLDGVDFDWEYPGATDIPGMPPGSPSDGANYLKFLRMLRANMPAGKTISMAAPASYYYLKGYPIADMANVLDYIVYMTYDLHGQWDYTSSGSQSGCASGNCLRSHVNITDTAYALAMITRAGVPANKIAIGLASYGRSFGMVDKSCTGPSCFYKGPASAATPGNCTKEAGVLAQAEILQAISANAPGTLSYHDGGSDSDIAVLPDGTWVAYMSDNTKGTRTGLYQFYNFGGTADWAVDLSKFV